MKNILVTKFYTLTERFYLYDDLKRVNQRYSRARDLLLASAEKWLLDVDEIICDTHEVKHDQEMFLHHAQVLRNRYQSEPCNILYCDLDIVFVKPTRMFGEYNQFSMCSGNCGVRYYPHGGMTKQQWNIQQQWINRWKTVFKDEPEHIANWDYEQNMYNEMHRDAMRENLFINKFENNVHNMYNEPKLGYTLVHCCGTTQKFDSLKLQEHLWELSKLSKFDDIHTVLSDPLYSKYNPSATDDNPWFGPPPLSH